MASDLFESPPAERVWSSHQNLIFEEFAHGIDNFVVKAYAGVGKTTTAVHGIGLVPERRPVFCAFGNRIAVDINAKLAEAGLSRIEAKTAHALGFSIIRKYRDRITVEKKENTGDRAAALTLAVCGLQPPDAIKRLVTKLHCQGRENAPHATKVGELTDLAIRFECEPDEEWTKQGFGLSYVEQKALDVMELASQVKSGDTIDFSDMIFLPVRNHWMSPQYDFGLIDEAQDMTVTQLEILQGVVNGRIGIIGDENQAIFGFRGADSTSISRLTAELQAKEFILPITYRCARAIVREAQRFVPDFEAGPDNPEGEVLYTDMDKLTVEAGPGDFILSRVNAPLVSIAMKLLRSGKRTRIAGKDIGKGLVSLIRKFKGRSVPDLLAKITAWETREKMRVEAQLKVATGGRIKTLQAKIDGIVDQADMLTSLADGARNVDEVLDRIDDLFSDNGLGDAGVITCSSVHKAKGLEADKVFVLADTMRDYNKEEKAIEYVAITRAKHTLVYVTAAAKEQV